MTGLVAGLAAAVLLALAVSTVVARDAVVAIVGFVCYGLLLALAWVRLSGPDVALTEAAIGGGLTGVLLLGAAARLRGTERAADAERCGARTRAVALLLSGVVAAGLGAFVLGLPDPAPTLAAEVRARLGETGVGNPITAVLLAFRAMDTLLETLVLVIALVGAWSLAPDGAWGGRPGPRHPVDPDGILAYFARVLPPVGVIVGAYVFWAGADHPGGKFQGATLLAAMWMLVTMAGLADTPPTGRRWVRAGLVAGPLAFIAVGLIGPLTGGAFLAAVPGFAKPTILFVETVLMPTLVLVLVLLLAGTPTRGGSRWR